MQKACILTSLFLLFSISFLAFFVDPLVFCPAFNMTGKSIFRVHFEAAGVDQLLRIVCHIENVYQNCTLSTCCTSDAFQHNGFVNSEHIPFAQLTLGRMGQFHLCSQSHWLLERCQSALTDREERGSKESGQNSVYSS